MAATAPSTPSLGNLVPEPRAVATASTAPSAPEIATDRAPTLPVASSAANGGSVAATPAPTPTVPEPLPTLQGTRSPITAGPAREPRNAVTANATGLTVAPATVTTAKLDPTAVASAVLETDAAPVPPPIAVAANLSRPTEAARASRATPVAAAFSAPIYGTTRTDTASSPSTVLTMGKADVADTTAVASAPTQGLPNTTVSTVLPPQSGQMQPMAEPGDQPAAITPETNASDTLAQSGKTGSDEENEIALDPAVPMAVPPVALVATTVPAVPVAPATPETNTSATAARPGKAERNAAHDAALGPATPMAVPPVALAATTVPVMPVAPAPTVAPAVPGTVAGGPAAPLTLAGTSSPNQRQPIAAPNVLPTPAVAASSALPDESPPRYAPESPADPANPAPTPSPVTHDTALPTAQNPIAEAPPSASPAGPAVPVAKTAPDAIAATVVPAENSATPAARPAVRARRDHADAEVETPDQSSPAMAAVTPPPTPTDATGGIPATAQPSPPPQTAAQDTTRAAPASAPAPREVSVSAIVPPADTGLSTPQPSLASNPAPILPTPGLAAPADAPQNPRNADLPPGQPAGTAAAAMVAPTAVGARAPIATAAPRTLISAQPGRIGRETGVAIAHRIGTGGDEMTLHLSPASLGRIEVKIAFEDGSLRATLRADNPAALDLLRRDSTDLSRALDQAGVRSDSASLSFQGRGADGQPAGSRQQSPFADFAQRGQQADSPATPIPDSYQPLRTSSRVDFLA